LLQLYSVTNDIFRQEVAARWN